MAFPVQHAEDLEAEELLLQADSSDEGRPVRSFTSRAAAAAVAGALALAGTALLMPSREAQHEQAFEGSMRAINSEVVGLAATECKDAKEGDSCYFSVHWAMTAGIFEHPEWYKGLTSASTFADFQANLFKAGAKNCSNFKPCRATTKLDADAEDTASTRVSTTDTAADTSSSSSSSAAAAVPKPGPRAQTFYMYRAQSQDSYPLSNINAADLAGVFWYVHNEVVVATPRKYKIDRIKRFKVTTKNSWEFWNAHKRQFGAFVAYDAGGCTTPVCKDIYHQYGFIVGCQVQPLSVAGYLGRHQTNWQCRAGEDKCKAPIWYSLPGPCPDRGMPNGDINPNSDDLDVNKYKSPECIERMPGGLCPKGTTEPTGAPDCTYTYEEAGHIFLDDLVGIGDYNQFWNTSFTDCMKNGGENCRHNKEYVAATDEGVGTSFWNGKLDTEKCTERLEKARELFKEKYPEFPEHLDEPACEFDMYYGGEFKWKINHTNAPHSDYWSNRMSD